MSQKVKDPSAYDYTPMMPPALLESYRKAMKGDAASMYQMAEAFRQGTEVPRNSKVAIDWLRLAAEKHHPEAMYNYSYACKGNVIARVEWMRSAAEAGHHVAMYDLALMYAEGTLIAQDWSLCEQWMTRSAKKGNRKAKDYLGWMYHNGRAGTVDLVQAMRWYEDAAMHGSTRSALALGEIHTFEREHFDPEKAFFWYRFAAYSGDAEAQTNLGYCYQSGIGTEKDAKEAFKWTQEGARRGDRRAMFVLGNYHRWGYGTRTDDRKAFEWMSRSAEKGYARALDTLGVYHSNGIGTPRDIVRGFECYRGPPRRETPTAAPTRDGSSTRDSPPDAASGRRWPTAGRRWRSATARPRSTQWPSCTTSDRA
ncbi:MAG: sel1 repeat family protein [archaeon]|nr:sel1 repeat family protein [archaeon]